MTFSKFLNLFRSDLYRYGGRKDFIFFLKRWFLSPGLKVTFYFRLCQYLAAKPLKAFGLYYFYKFLLIQNGFRYGIDLPASTKVGSGLYIGHFGEIVINNKSVIGNNCNLSQGVTIGQQNRGAKAGCPTIGNNVFIGPGAKILGRISVGNGAAIGANCVVVEDVPENAVVVGVPGRVISRDGSQGYINFIDY